MHQYYFEKLRVWKEAIKFNSKIYVLTRDFPKEELYGLTSQLKRSSLSISNNIAEGISRVTTKEKLRFLTIAYSSLMEVLNCLIVAEDLNYISIESLHCFRKKIDEISNMILNLKKTIKKKQTTKPPNQPET